MEERNNFMKGLWTSDWIWFKSQKRFLLMMAFLIVCFLFSGQSSFLILYFPLFLTILSTRRVLEGVSGRSARFLFTLPFSRKDYLIEKYLFVLACWAMTMAVCFGIACLQRDLSMNELLLLVWLTSVICLLLAAILIPFYIRFKQAASQALMIAVALLALASIWLMDYLTEHPQAVQKILSHALVLGVIATLLCIGLLCLSFWLSGRLLSREEF